MDGFMAPRTALPVGLVVTDRTGLIVMTNPALDRMFGYAAGELTSRKMEALIPAHPTCHVPGLELMARHANGHEFPVEVSLATLDMTESPLVLASIIDLSFHKTHERALRQANAQLEEFARLAAHDLRAPLRAIADLLAWIRTALGDAALTPDIARNFDRAQLRVNRAERMIHELLTYATAAQPDEQIELIDPAALIEETLTLLGTPEHFAIEVAVSAAPFHAARTPLTIALRNLLGNAMKHHGGARGKVRVRVHEEGRYNVFTVEDDGAGLPAGAEDMIFNRLSCSGTRDAGHGLGLAVTRRKVTLHGGMLQLDPAGTLGGACFRIHWPRNPLPRSA
jgi:two-component system sensor kinase FixL